MNIGRDWILMEVSDIKPLIFYLSLPILLPGFASLGLQKYSTWMITQRIVTWMVM